MQKPNRITPIFSLLTVLLLVLAASAILTSTALGDSAKIKIFEQDIQPEQESSSFDDISSRVQAEGQYQFIAQVVRSLAIVWLSDCLPYYRE